MERRRSRSNSNVSLGAGESSSTEQKEPPPSTSTPTTSAPITTTAPTSSEAEPSAITTASASSVITTKPYIVHVESEPLSINQQLSNHLAATAVSQALLANSKPPAAKRKRGSLDTTQRSPLALKAQQPAEMKKIGFIGSGNIARAITEGWITGGVVKPSNITVTARSVLSNNLKLMKVLGVNGSTSNRDVIGHCDMIIIAVKPYQVLGVMQEIHHIFKTSGSHTPKALRPLVVSVAASVPLAEIEKKAEINWNIGGSPITGHLPIIRCVPNIGCRVQSGVTVFSRGKFCNEEDVKPFMNLFSTLGHCEEVEERYMDPFVALTGSGLAFMEMALEAMADGGVMAGLPHAISLRMSAHTMLGAANLVLKKNLHPAQVKNAVASPAGTTISGVLALESGGFRAAMMSAIKAAVDKARELRQSS